MPRISRKNPPIEPATVQKRTYQVGVYLRLSVEDARKRESDSIGTQKALVLQYLHSQPDMALAGIYQDVNYSGTHFNRPEFSRMMEDVKSGKINCVMVKDLSRFGRNYLETGTYLEYIFPMLNIRFIAINDRYDSFSADKASGALVIPIKNLMNEIYARDISKKSKSQYAVKRKRGDFCGAFAPFGYIKAGNRLEVDEVAAAIVQEIFNMAEKGLSDNAIAQSLNDKGVLPPGRYGWEKGVVKDEKYRQAQCWNRTTVSRILSNPVYTGKMVGGKYQRDFLEKKSLHKTDTDYAVCENTHPAIISQSSFDAAINARKVVQTQGGAPK